MAAPKRGSCARIVLFLLVGILCVGTLASIWVLDAVPRQAEQDFGKPTPNLSRLQTVLYSIQMLSVRSKITEPINPSGTKINFKIDKDQTVARIALNLESAGLIQDAGAFRLFVVYAGLDTSIKAGEYSLSPAQNIKEIANTLQDATSAEVTFRILPGWRMEEIAAALPTSGIKVSPEQFLETARLPAASSIPSSLEKVKTFEGFFLPDTYRFKRETSAQEMVSVFLKRFDEKVSFDLRAAFQRQGLDLHQAVILASIIQREAVVVEEQPMIASVFFNRLKIKMKLDSDPTVQYAVGYNSAQNTWWTNPLSTAHLKTNSPYNTYIMAGLPPGAIANPGLDALQSVANPAQSPYFYFRAACDGTRKHKFAVTYEEHLKNGCP